jgi:nucleotide-binding universal stress UspA family protein
MGGMTRPTAAAAKNIRAVTKMSYASIMVYIDADGAPEQRVRIAAGLADKFDATLIGLSALGIPPTVVTPNGMVISQPTDVDFELMRAKLARNGAWFCSIAAAPNRKLEWRSELDLPREAWVRHARCADLVVIGTTKAPASIYTSLDAGGIVLRIGRPTLVVPEEIASLAAGRVVIGWKDTREARRAVQDALPLLGLATRVTIVEACSEDEDKSALARLNDVARYLRRHGIDCDPKVVHQQGSGAAQLIEIARGERADLLVTGAYGHSRFGEWIFGGVTRELLTHSPICCLMSH